MARKTAVELLDAAIKELEAIQADSKDAAMRRRLGHVLLDLKEDRGSLPGGRPKAENAEAKPRQKRQKRAKVDKAAEAKAEAPSETTFDEAGNPIESPAEGGSILADLNNIRERELATAQ